MKAVISRTTTRRSWCSARSAARGARLEISIRLRELKVRSGLSPDFEIKWTKISPAKVDFYLSVLDYFFDDDDLSFRALVVPDKSSLDHGSFR